VTIYGERKCGVKFQEHNTMQRPRLKLPTFDLQIAEYLEVGVFKKLIGLFFQAGVKGMSGTFPIIGRDLGLWCVDCH